MSASRRVITLVVVLVWLSTALSGRLQAAVQTDVATNIYLPLVMNGAAWPSPYGIQTYPGRIQNPVVLAKAQEPGAKWLRLRMVSWRQVQPNQGDPYAWSVLQSFEGDLRAASQARLTPIVVVNDNPGWATLDLPYPPYQTSCGAIREDRVADFAAFMAALVARYKAPPYNVQDWELSNEPDVDPRLVPADSADVDCWGQIEDPYDGGEHFGRMLRAVTPRIKQTDLKRRC